MRVDSRPGMSVRRGPISTRGSEYDRYGGPSPRPLFDEFETSRHRMSRDPYAIRANDVLRFGPRVPAQQGLGRLSSDAADSYDSMRKPYVPRLLDDFARQPLPFDSREYSRESSGTSLNRSGWNRSYNPTYGFSYAAGWQ
ncbi:hypothetical protein AB6A40_001176 [Gnathostoma spinigerum]|uniref:Uncharacterized protein n=1 Tax=Gnathostoma spinigerum TaxID=75299 RepID=A0ABD6ED94_9BILA